MLTKIALLLAIACFSMAFGIADIMPGGIGMCEDVTSTHEDTARRAVRQMKENYTLRKVLGVRTQAVQGFNEYFELLVSRNAGTSYETCEMCDVEVSNPTYEFPSVQKYSCKESCCF